MRYTEHVIRFIVAIDDKHGLADDQGIPWDLPSDKRYFRHHTEGSTVLMGYKTYEEFGQPLSNRRNLVATTRTDELRPGFEVVSDARNFLVESKEDIWVIGGAGLFTSTLDLAYELYITRVEGDFNCTKFFPSFEDKFELFQKSDTQQENGIKFHYEIWKRK